MTLLQLQDVTYRYKNTAEAVLYQINYNFEPGKFYSIIGESGAGKSTLLSLLAGLDSPVEGSILFQVPVKSLLRRPFLSTRETRPKLRLQLQLSTSHKGRWSGRFGRLQLSL